MGGLRELALRLRPHLCGDLGRASQAATADTAGPGPGFRGGSLSPGGRACPDWLTGQGPAAQGRHGMRPRCSARKWRGWDPNSGSNLAPSPSKVQGSGHTAALGPPSLLVHCPAGPQLTAWASRGPTLLPPQAPQAAILQQPPEGAHEHLSQAPPSSAHSPPGRPPPSGSKPSSPCSPQDPAGPGHPSSPSLPLAPLASAPAT